MMVDFVKVSVPMLYSRNKNREYREGVVSMATSLLGFLYSEGVICKNPFDDEHSLKMDYVLRESELSVEGKELFKSAIPKWWRKIDSGLSPSNVDYLSSELEKIRSHLRSQSKVQNND